LFATAAKITCSKTHTPDTIRGRTSSDAEKENRTLMKYKTWKIEDDDAREDRKKIADVLC
jgi:hypothetical protein